MMGLWSTFLSGWGATCFSAPHLKREEQSLTSSNSTAPATARGRRGEGKEGVSGLAGDLAGLGLNSHWQPRLGDWGPTGLAC